MKNEGENLKIAILSDLHLGYGRGEAPAGEGGTQEKCGGTEGAQEKRELGGDALMQAREALKIASKSDLILVPGDIFDQRVPRQETLAQALELFSSIEPPIIAISGTHERRSSGYINPVQALEKAGFLTHLHCSSKTLEIKGKKVNIFGMSGVPERLSLDILKKWNPTPIPGNNSLNILLLHQNLEEYIYNPIDPVTLSLSNLPQNFGLIVNGHIHWRDISKTPTGTPVLLPGSTIRTQLKKAETEPKGVTFFSPPEKFDFFPLKTQRKFHYEVLKFEKATPQQVMAKIKSTLSSLETKNSLIKLKLTGTLAKNIRPADINTHSISSDAALLSIDKNFESKTKSRKAITHTSESIEELGLRLLREKLGSDQEELFHELRDGNLEKAKEKLLT